MSSGPTATSLRLRPPGIDDEAAVLAAHEELGADDFLFCLGLDAGMSWSQYLSRIEAQRRGDQLPEGSVPATFLLAWAEDDIVGRSSIRHELNSFLEREGGHIGFGVRPAYRRRGYATAILRQSLVIAWAAGIERILVTCDDDNLASASVIERCGGVLDSMVEPEAGGTLIRRYWID